ncbi:hypothetical protein [Umezawaea beigongshangensis]|uniref:hypothetical protein n=1 Tax=Umezawaea beigongshangensis TaxID=2780383 RepID=UPI0018F1D569|nr:hypothetical protein [Umezawaea beigongshangensis]
MAVTSADDVSVDRVSRTCGGDGSVRLRQEHPAAPRRSRIGFVLQAVDPVGAPTVQQNTVRPSPPSGQRSDRERTTEVVNRVGLGGRLRHRPSELCHRQPVASGKG